MFWVVQNNLYEERGYHALVDTLQDRRIPYVLVRIAPIVHRLLPHDFDTRDFHGDISDIAEAAIDESGLVVTSGSIELSHVAKARSWTPGTFLNENFDWRVWGQHYGKDALNSGGTMCRLDEVSFGKAAFIRPVLDDKSFPGRVMNRGAFEAWRTQELSRQNALGSVQPDTMVVVAPPREVVHEHRFFVVDGDIVTASRYRLGRTLSVQAGAEPAAYDFARAMVALWQPARAFVLDTVLVQEQGRAPAYYVMEPGCINSAGFYAADVTRIVDALEGMRFSSEPGLRSPL